MSTQIINFAATMVTPDDEVGIIALGASSLILIVASNYQQGPETVLSFSLGVNCPVLASGSQFATTGSDVRTSSRWCIVQAKDVIVTVTQNSSYGAVSLTCAYDILSPSLFASISSSNNSIFTTMFNFSKEDILDLFFQVFSQTPTTIKPKTISQSINATSNSGGTYTIDDKKGVYFGQLEISAKASSAYTLSVSALVNNSPQNIAVAEKSIIDFEEDYALTTTNTVRQQYSNVYFDKLVVVNSDPANVNVVVTFKGYYIPYNN